MSDNLDLFIQALKECIKGIPLTLSLTALSILVGFILSVGLAMLLQRKKGLITRSVNGFVFFFTGSPFLVQLYIFYYGIPSWGVIGQLMDQPGFGFLKNGFIWVLIALTLNTAAYSCVIFAGYMRTVDRGEYEAARSYGMGGWKTMRRIVVPSALRKALPAYSNEVISVLHATALASVVTVPEITGQAIFFNQTYYPPQLVGYGAAAVIYLVLNGILLVGFRLLERKYTIHLRVKRS